MAEAPPLPTNHEAATIADIVTQTMRAYHAPALSLAIASRGQWVYQQGFGLADQRTGELATAASRFRIASLTKPITAVAIFSLIEQGRLGLHDPVFGQRGLLAVDDGARYPDLVSQITLYHLLTHTGGGWANDDADPMFRHPEMNHQELIAWAVRHQPLRHAPGTHYAYSNFGYCLLGRVIENITGQTYAEYVQHAVLERCGIQDMTLAGNTLAQRAPGEVIYGQNGSDREPYEMNLTRMDSHGGWIATPSDMVRFAMHVDGFNATPDILSADSINAMTTPSPANTGYACGWCVNKVPNWWHRGSLPGSLTIMARTASGLCWAAFTNTRRDGLNLDAMMWKVVKAVPAWRA
ncbi:serine hydrolase domain-containing protein [Thiocystis minor]|uniref:serine hydrolase domain-containing protein n=1 Tax=Thiocystis minor TaxID=61597 RepID=UPI001913A991|nr:serine hydrolase domain-containing protein [Thiocystis minor]